MIFFTKEARLEVVPALHDVQRYAIKMNAGAARHWTVIAKISTPALVIAPLTVKVSP